MSMRQPIDPAWIGSSSEDTSGSPLANLRAFSTPALSLEEPESPPAGGTSNGEGGPEATKLPLLPRACSMGVIPTGGSRARPKALSMNSEALMTSLRERLRLQSFSSHGSMSRTFSGLAEGMLTSLSSFSGELSTGSRRRRFATAVARMIIGQRQESTRSRRGSSSSTVPREQEEEEVRERSQSTCYKRLERLEQLETQEGVQPLTKEELEEELECLFHYKGRPLQGRLLHFAVFLQSEPDGRHGEHLVRRVLSARADLRGKARYTRSNNKVNNLEAVHVAAGLGSVQALRTLAEWAKEPVAYVNTFSVIDEKEFYVPLHDAAFLGQKDSILWLLENRADPSKPNMNGYTALHWLATKGHEIESELETMVKALVRHRARLDKKTKAGYKKDGKDMIPMIPLELAADADSQFPRRLMHLLAPSFQTQEGSQRQHSFFDDMCMLSSHHADAAKQLGRQLLESEDPMVMRKVRLDAQKDNAVDRLANLFHMAPEAAADLLEALLVKPLVQDPGHHPIRSRASLWGLFYSRPMRCAYQADVKQREDSLKMPEWRCQPNKPEVAWHAQLIQAPDEHEDGREYVDDVETKVVLLPNILDIDIFMALACTRPANIRIFERLPVQGVIYCLWDHLILPALYTRLACNVVDLVVQAAWGLSNAEGAPEGEDTNSPLNAPHYWSIVAAGWLRDSINVAWWFQAHWRKWCGHQETFWQWKLNEEGGNTTPTGERQTMGRPPSLHALWRPQVFFTASMFITEVPLNLAKAAFIFSTCFSGGEDGRMSDFQQGALTTSTLLHGLRLIYTLRLTNFGKNVTTILSAFFSRAICEMLVVVSLVFSVVTLAFSMLKRKQTSAWITLYLYKGLLFGDGDALNYMGLNPEGQVVGIRTFLMVVTTVIFNVCMLNLTIAIYSSEYDRLEKESELHFLRERAKYCCEFLLSLQKHRFQGTSNAPGGDPYMRPLKALACLAVAAGGLFLMLGAGGAPSLTRQAAAAVCFAAAQIAVQTVWMASDWFPYREGGREGPEEEHFLWISYRANLDAPPQAEELHESARGLGRLELKMQKELGRLDEKVDSLGCGITSKLDALTLQIQRLATAQEATHATSRSPAAP